MKIIVCVAILLVAVYMPTFTKADDVSSKGNILLVSFSAPSHFGYLHAIGSGLIEWNYTVYTVLADTMPRNKASLHPGINVLTFHSEDDPPPRVSKDFQKNFIENARGGKSHQK